MGIKRVQLSSLFGNRVQETTFLVPASVLRSQPNAPALAHVPGSYNLGIAWENGEMSSVPLSKPTSRSDTIKIMPHLQKKKAFRIV